MIFPKYHFYGRQFYNAITKNLFLVQLSDSREKIMKGPQLVYGVYDNNDALDSP